MLSLLKVRLATAGLVAGILAALPVGGQAQGVTRTIPCTGYIAFTAMYATSTGAGPFQYVFQIENRSRVTIEVDLALGSFPADVTLRTTTYRAVPLRPSQQLAFRFGQGTTGNINMSTVATLTDSAGAAGPYVRAMNCKA